MALLLLLARGRQTRRLQADFGTLFPTLFLRIRFPVTPVMPAVGGTASTSVSTTPRSVSASDKGTLVEVRIAEQELTGGAVFDIAEAHMRALAEIRSQAVVVVRVVSVITHAHAARERRFVGRGQRDGGRDHGLGANQPLRVILRWRTDGERGGPGSAARGDGAPLDLGEVAVHPEGVVC